MKRATNTVEELTRREYKYGFVSDIESDSIPAGLNEDVIRVISAKKHEPDFMLDWRLKAYRYWAKLEKSQAEPKWANVHYPSIDYQKIIYYAAPKAKDDRPKSLEEVDPELLRTYEKLGIPLREQGLLAGIAVDAVFDSVSVATTFKAKLGEMGIIFCSFSEAVQNHPELVQKYLGSVLRQLFCRAQCRGLQRRFILLHSQGSSLSHGTLHLFSHQRLGDGPVRTDSYRRGGRQLCKLSRRLHGADAGHQPAACGRR